MHDPAQVSWAVISQEGAQEATTRQASSRKKLHGITSAALCRQKRYKSGVKMHSLASAPKAQDPSLEAGCRSSERGQARSWSPAELQVRSSEEADHPKIDLFFFHNFFKRHWHLLQAWKKIA